MADNYSEYEFEETMVTLTDEYGNERDFYIDEIYEADGRQFQQMLKILQSIMFSG